MTGWNLPPGCTSRMIEDMFADRPCEVCGMFPDDCICPECPHCSSVGDPKCYAEHGLVRSPEQIKSLAEVEATWKAEAEAEAKYYEEMMTREPDYE